MTHPQPNNPDSGRREGVLVTGDAVVLELHLAKSASRALSYGIDVLVQILSLLIIGVVFDTAGRPDDVALTVAIIIGVQLLVMVGYPAICETLTRGKTLGKLALGVRAVRDDGGPIRMRHALVRALTGAFVDFGPLGAWSFIGFLVSLSSRDGKRVGDYLAGTVVIRERVPEQAGAYLMMPPTFGPWAAQLDLSGLPNELALSARRYLDRYRDLNDAARESLGMRLAYEVSERIGAPVPEGVSAWSYLSAVLAERRDRARRATSAAAPAPPAGPTSPYPPARQATRESTVEESGPFAPPG